MAKAPYPAICPYLNTLLRRGVAKAPYPAICPYLNTLLRRGMAKAPYPAMCPYLNTLLRRGMAKAPYPAMCPYLNAKACPLRGIHSPADLGARGSEAVRTVRQGLPGAGKAATMVMDERARYRMQRRLAEVIDEETAVTLMAHLPPGGWTEVATRSDIARLDERLDRLEQRFDGIEQRVGGIEGRLGRNLRAHIATTILAVIATGSLVLGAVTLV
jgi:polyhydroxyalkanoate synthesis regulator phasin